MQEIFCQVDDIQLLGNDVYQVKLVSDELTRLPYSAGQYLTLQADGGRWIPFSIGNAPEETSHLELHIKLIPGHELAELIVDQLKSTKQAHIQIPMGECVLRDGPRPVVCIVGGTGFSPIKAMLESAFAQQDPREFYLYWGAAVTSDFYLDELPSQWQRQYTNFNYVPVLSGDDAQWQGERGLVHQTAMSQLSDLANKDFYISGSEAMVMAVYHDLLGQGVPKSQIFADMLDIKREMGETV
ncbi:NAD(P)H-flavin reductase [Pleionea mediterranea]|uniref:CDP-4-dehydro-6-deoxyglucose reductase n=1 Tax=Pleionea mediterranea TaxID=523701 RepID=A0A316FD66_9GAMM|nr:NAD(P)H-flavin reductase [Pleionea mediterranea]PWK46824.1 CDP-4-dehydro-6-deoxyglucose reductase [Pleionea mediterranea]